MAKLTPKEHRAKAAKHRERAIETKLMIDGGLIDGMHGDKHRRLVEEFVDELICAAHHFSEGSE